MVQVMAKLTANDKHYKDSVRTLNQEGVIFRRLKYGSIELKLKPWVQDLGQIERPGLTDVEYCHGYRVYIGQFAILEQRIPSAAFEEGAEWSVLNTRKVSEGWKTWVVLQPTKESGLWNEVVFTPSLIT